MKNSPARASHRHLRKLAIERCEQRDLLTTLELLPVADNTLFEDSSGSISNGAGQHLFSGRVAGGGGGDLRRGLVQFDLAGNIPAGATINSVSLQLNVSRSISGDVPVSLHRVLASWGEGASDAPGQEGQGTAATPGDATWVHRNFPGTQWQSEGGDFEAQASSTIQVGGVGFHTWSSEQLVADVNAWLVDPTLNFGWILVGDEGTLGTAKRFDSRENTTDANRPRLVIDFDVATTTQDFGDAPSAAQLGFASDYPVTLAQNGARHTVGSLFLGASIDGESDGSPTIDASGDGADEDGIGFVTSLLVGPGVTASSLTVTASEAGWLDAWIDFNADGDWDDVGEQILTSAAVDQGLNTISISLPGGATAGETGARFRISGQGGLAPTGAASDGEVEDYIVSLVAGNVASDVTADLVETNIVIASDAGDVVIQSGQSERFRAPNSAIGTLNISATPQDDTIMLDLANDAVIPSGGLVLSGAAGDNRLIIVGAGGSLNLADPNITVTQVGTLDLGSPDPTLLTLDAAVVSALSPVQQQVQLVIADGDQVQLLDVTDWRLTEPVIVDGVFQLTAANQNSGEILQAEVSRPWQNFIQPSDVSSDGAVTALDALQIINELSNQSFSQPNGDLLDPSAFNVFPGTYVDQNGDGRVTALDALRVINELALQSISGEGESVQSPRTSSSANQSAQQAAVFQAAFNSLEPWIEDQIRGIVF